ncbi:MAG: FkbM family methyltransferase [Proteobacteria bacterium]|nr:FkbM family methyltransferase [Pseudomonadota bacterium]
MLLKLTRNPHIPLTLRKKAGKMRPKPPAGQTFRTDFFGSLYEGTTGNHMDDKIYMYGMHEPATIRLMRAILERQRQDGASPVLLDIGTNKGQHLIAAAALADKAFGFEPWHAVRERAEKNVALNNFGHVKVFPFGLSDKDAELPFRAPKGDNFGVGSFAGADGGSSLKLPVRRGDDVMKEYGIAPTLIKIDVEGFEKPALEGLCETLRARRPAVIFEYSRMSRADFDPPENRKAIFGDGYRYFGIRPSRETPCLTDFVPGRRYENILAWPGRALPYKK